ncbi:MAG: DUF1289 domain-containing protein [Pseudomonadota bacterium]
MTTPAPARRPLPPSPCVGICEMDETLELCRGCARTAEEIVLWRDAEPAYHKAVFAELPARAERLGLRLRRLSWEPEEILSWAADRLTAGEGCWVIGPPGAVAEVSGSAQGLSRSAEALVAQLEGAALRLIAPRGTKAFAWRPLDTAPERIVLALPTVRLGEPDPAELTPLGPDQDALLPGDEGAPRFDLGLGRAAARFSVRSRDAALLAALEAAVGQAFPAHLAKTRDALFAAQPVRVIETPLARAEIATPIPLGDERTQPGPHTHLLPAILSEGLATPAGLAMPPAFTAAALWIPA